MTLPVDLVVFDMIGTTIAATDNIPRAFEMAFGAEGIELGPNRLLCPPVVRNVGVLCFALMVTLWRSWAERTAARATG